MNPGENWAQTVFRVLGNLFRTLLTLLVLFVGAIGAASYVINLYYEAQQAELKNIRRAEEAARPINFVSASIEYDFRESDERAFATGCSADYPYLVVIKNDSEKAMTETFVELSVRKKGTSEILRFRGRKLGGGLSEHWFDASDSTTDVVREIILPGSRHGYCRKFPPEDFLNFDREALYVFNAQISSSTKFQEPADWMYEELGVSRGDP